MSVITAPHVHPRPSQALPPLRLLPVPVCEPPYDDELEAQGRTPPVTHFALPTPVGPLSSLPPLPLRLVHDFDDDDQTTSRTPASQLPQARPVAHALVQGLLEVLAGVRPVSQLQRSTSPELFLELEALVHGRPRATGSRPATGAVRSLHVQQRPEGVAEVCATVQRGRRAAAIALRLEGRDGQWRCTEIAGL
jgi:hypothetical protein